MHRPKQWGEDFHVHRAYFGSYCATCHRRSSTKIRSEEPATPQARRRQYIYLLAGLAMVLLYGASTSCWGCIDDVSLGPSGGLFDVEAQLLLRSS